MRLATLLVTAVAACTGCASASHHPSAAQHQALAAENETAAREHLTSAPYFVSRPTSCFAQTPEPCWSPNQNVDRALAEEHMKEAMRHRAASETLLGAQARACSGVAQSDRDVSPFAHVQDIAAVEPIVNGRQLLGARVTFHAVQGLTTEAFQRIVDCHVAEADALGHNVPEESFCPLNLPNVKATVTAVPNGYDVAIVTDDGASAKEVLRRAQGLTP